MFRDLRITNFRGFRNFQMDGLGRINLLVGPNNCGKSTVLEAIDLLADYPDPVIVGLQCYARGGVSQGESENSQSNWRILLRHIFFGRHAKPGTKFILESNTETGKHTLQVGIEDERISVKKHQKNETMVSGKQMLLFEKSGSGTVTHTISLTNQAEWRMSDFNSRFGQIRDNLNVNLLSSRARSQEAIIRQLGTVSLNPEEQFVLDVLRTLDPRIIGITALPSGSVPGYPDNRNGVFVKLSGEPERVPIASLGDGVWRLLGLALALVHARGSILLVDEIDIGLHYTAQVDMWRMVKGAAEKLDVQVFATTHSSDCIRALASLARPDVTTGSDITIQRIEGERAVAYNEREIVLAAERGIEVR